MHSTVRKKKQILVVEDEGLIAADLQDRLERMGYAVPAIAHSGEEALRCARSTPLDLVLMDIRIKGEMDGVATALALKAEFETPVVYMTAHSDKETIERAKLTGPSGYILKPISDGSLRSTVQVALYKSEMERRLRASEAWLSATLRSVGEGLIATDTSGEIVFMNPVAEQLTGWRSQDARGLLLMDVLALFLGPDTQPAKNPVFDLFPGEERSYTLISREGTQSAIEVACFENRAGDELLGAIVVVRNIAARMELEASLVQSQRMEAIAGMAGYLAHDFNNQLMVVLGYAEDLCERLSGEAREEALGIKEAASIATSLSGQLLTLSRRGAVKRQVLNVNEVICEIQPVLSHTLGKARALITDLGSPLGFLRGDRNQLKQVLLNLTLNARDAMPQGGTLRIETAVVEIGADSAEDRLHRPGVYVRLRFVDSGEGMDKATLARIFEPFFTTKKDGRGTGLGLSITHSIVVRDGGYIVAASECGKGTSFEILLPCIGTFCGIGEGSGMAVRNDEDVTPTILLVEDEAGVRKLVHGYLEREGFQLLEASNAEEAELIAEVYQEPIHVLVTDVMMPGMTGVQLAQRLAPLRPDMRTLFVSGYRHDTLERHGVGSEANVLPKPFPASELLRRVRMLLPVSVSSAR